MGKFLHGLMLACLLSDTAIAQTDSGTALPDTSNATFEVIPALRPDTVAEPGIAMPLLPEIMGPMERVFWGKSGLMRNMGFPLDEVTREREMHLRRNMLTAHQIGGFMTLATMTATVVTGQILLSTQPKTNAHAGHTGDPPAEHDHGIHGVKSVLAWTTVGLYSATALLSILTPPPMVLKSQWSSISWHKALGVAHFTGMFVTPFVILTVDDKDDARLLHQIFGYTTLAALAGAMVVVTF